MFYCKQVSEGEAVCKDNNGLSAEVNERCVQLL